MQFTRKQIIDYLKVHPTATVPELSQALSLTLSNIRHHIYELESQQIIERVGTQSPVGRGRPIVCYRLNTQVHDHNLDILASMLLKIATHALTPTQLAGFYQEIANQLTEKTHLSGSPTQQVQQVIQWLNQHHYRARWEASVRGPRITLFHCPYLALLPEFPSICQLDIAILSHLNNRPMEMSNQRQKYPSLPSPCIFTPKAQGEP
jgi:predicted ArsR family transcriptional regulator